MSLTGVTHSRDSLPVLHLNAPEIWQDIHAPLREAREAAAFGISGEGAIHVLRDAEVEACLRDPRFLAADLMALNGLTKGPLWEWWNSVMFSKNPPEHTRLRTLVSRAFTPRSVERLRPQIAAHVQTILGPASRRAVRRPGRPRPSPAARGDLGPARHSRSRPADFRPVDQAARTRVQRDT